MQIPDHISAMFTLFGSAYPSWKINEDTIRCLAALTSDIEPQSLLRSAIEHCRTSKWPPTAADLIALSNPGRAYRIRERITHSGDNRKQFLDAQKIAGTFTRPDQGRLSR